ncbi:MAG: aldolase/citrate lyase family protein [Pseudomonadota bacterium]
MIKPNRVKALFDDNKPAFGTWITLCPHPRVVKIMAAAGFDFLILEMEHTDFTLREIGVLAMYARECGITPVVRPPGTSKPHDLTRALDAGAQGLLLPSLDSAAQLEAIMPGIKYEPLGHRPMNLKGPHTDYAVMKPREMLDVLNEETMTIIMVETRASIDALSDILKVPGVDAVMIGPDDLSQDLRVPADMQNPILLEAYEEVFAACKAASIPFGLSSQSPSQAKTWLDKGAQWLPYQNDAAMVLNTARTAVPELMALAGRA